MLDHQLLVRHEGLLLIRCHLLGLLLLKLLLLEEDALVLGIRDRRRLVLLGLRLLANELLLNLAGLLFGHKLGGHAIWVRHLGAAFQVEILGRTALAPLTPSSFSIRSHVRLLTALVVRFSIHVIVSILTRVGVEATF